MREEGHSKGWNDDPESYCEVGTGLAQASPFLFASPSNCVPVAKHPATERERPILVAGSLAYGVSADAALAVDNLFAVQFHPEKSHTAGLQLLRNFLEWKPAC